jgi:hypothetical protein
MYTHSSNNNTPYNQTFEAPHVHAVAYKNGGLLRFVMFISEVSFYWRLVHVSKFLCPSIPLQPQPQLP